jgi:hypothetical protein
MGYEPSWRALGLKSSKARRKPGQSYPKSYSTPVARLTSEAPSLPPELPAPIPWYFQVPRDPLRYVMPKERHPPTPSVAPSGVWK